LNNAEEYYKALSIILKLTREINRKVQSECAHISNYAIYRMSVKWGRSQGAGEEIKKNKKSGVYVAHHMYSAMQKYCRYTYFITRFLFENFYVIKKKL